MSHGINYVEMEIQAQRVDQNLLTNNGNDICFQIACHFASDKLINQMAIS